MRGPTLSVRQAQFLLRCYPHAHPIRPTVGESSAAHALVEALLMTYVDPLSDRRVYLTVEGSARVERMLRDRDDV